MAARGRLPKDVMDPIASLFASPTAASPSATGFGADTIFAPLLAQQMLPQPAGAALAAAPAAPTPTDPGVGARPMVAPSLMLALADAAKPPAVDGSTLVAGPVAGEAPAPSPAPIATDVPAASAPRPAAAVPEVAPPAAQRSLRPSIAADRQPVPVEEVAPALVGQEAAPIEPPTGKETYGPSTGEKMDEPPTAADPKPQPAPMPAAAPQPIAVAAQTPAPPQADAATVDTSADTGETAIDPPSTDRPKRSRTTGRAPSTAVANDPPVIPTIVAMPETGRAPPTDAQSRSRETDRGEPTIDAVDAKTAPSQHQAVAAHRPSEAPAARPETAQPADPGISTVATATAAAPQAPAADRNLAGIPPTTPHAVTAEPGRIGHETGIAIARHVATGGGDTIAIRLDPVEMGRIEVRLSFDDAGTLQAVVAADNPASLDMLRRDSGDLVRALADSGVQADARSFQFDTRSGERGGGWQRPAPFDQPSTGNGITDAEAEPVQPDYRPIAARGRVDVTA